MFSAFSFLISLLEGVKLILFSLSFVFPFFSSTDHGLSKVPVSKLQEFIEFYSIMIVKKKNYKKQKKKTNKTNQQKTKITFLKVFFKMKEFFWQ